MGRIIRHSLLGLVVALAGLWVWLAFRQHPKIDRPVVQDTPEIPQPNPPASAQSADFALLPTTREAAEDRLHPCLGKTVREVIQLLGIEAASRSWSDEPPGILRGSTYTLADRRWVTFYIAPGEPLFRKFNEHKERDYEAFLDCRVGGIQYEAHEFHLDIGPAVPWQFRSFERSR